MRAAKIVLNGKMVVELLRFLGGEDDLPPDAEIFAAAYRETEEWKQGATDGRLTLYVSSNEFAETGNENVPEIPLLVSEQRKEAIAGMIRSLREALDEVEMRQYREALDGEGETEDTDGNGRKG